MGWSEEKEDWRGNKYIQHYDDDGKKTGWSQDKQDWRGETYTQHHDNSDKKTGWSEHKTDWRGNDYAQHRNNDDKKTSWSADKTDWRGNDYTQHFNNNDEKAGWSEHKTDWRGNPYSQHHVEDQKVGPPQGVARTLGPDGRTGSAGGSSTHGLSPRSEPTSTYPHSGLSFRSDSRSDKYDFDRLFGGLLFGVIIGAISIIPAYVLYWPVCIFLFLFQWLIIGTAWSNTWTPSPDSFLITIIALSTSGGFVAGYVSK